MLKDGAYWIRFREVRHHHWLGQASHEIHGKYQLHTYIDTGRQLLDIACEFAGEGSHFASQHLQRRSVANNLRYFLPKTELNYQRKKAQVLFLQRTGSLVRCVGVCIMLLQNA